ncbi:MAG: hypothetical protein ABEI96_04150 [Haloarculaceae archaeon]
MKRRKFVTGAGALFAGSAAAMGTGAFTTMESGDRDVEVKVAADSKAYVELHPDGKYAEETGDGKLRLFFNDQQAIFEGGVNPDSTYNFEDVFEIVADHTSGDTYFYLEKQGFDADVDFVAGENTFHMSEGDSLTDPNDLGHLVQPEGVEVDMTIHGTSSPNSAAGGTIILHAASGGNQGQL